MTTVAASPPLPVGHDAARAAGARELARQLARIHKTRWAIVDPHHPKPVTHRDPRA